MAKSAQFPLHVWLPDAMEGPTPISALIHAATMVAAGVFLVARLQPVYAPFPAVQAVIAVIGTITLFLGASIALTQQDLKKGLAYSTVSQLGYMMLAMGCGAPVAGMFHLVGHEPVLAQDMRLMGGLRRYMPVTASTFLIGCIAIAGIPPLAGFWSKDEILGQAFHHFPILWAAGFLTAGMTAFYMFRLYFLTFEGSFRGNDKGLQAQLLAAAGKSIDHEHAEQGDSHHADHPHESGWQMVTPLVVLAVPSVLIGLLGMPWNSRFAALVDPHEAVEMAENFSWQDFLPLAGSSVAISVAGISLAVLAYALHRIDLGQAAAARFPAVNRFLANKWNLDSINDKLFVQGSRKIARKVLDVDSKVVDGVVNLTGLLTLGSGEGLKYFETGRVQFYALIVFGGVIAMVVLFGAFG
jgi:NAD(P)H-quinone oxidoreductase subunit 5